jgi:serine protease AprX
MRRSGTRRSGRWAWEWTSRGATLTLALFVGLAVVQPAAGASTPPALFKADPALVRAARTAPSIAVIVRETAPATAAAEHLVQGLGGRVTKELPIIHAFAARIPGRALASLTASAAVDRVWGDAHVRMTGVDMGKYDQYAPDSVWKQETRVPNAQQRYNGAGVAVALLDTGIVPSADFGNRIVAAADLTFEGDGLDRYGHGTHMAGIIAGDGSLSFGAYQGIAPKANLVSVKVAGSDGSTDVSVVIAGIQWIVANRAKYNIRVLNLSFGTDSRQPYSVDPLDYAVEQAWFSGILVVVAAGNNGPTGSTISKPGDDPYVVTVGAANTFNTSAKSDDIVTDFSGRGPTQDGYGKPDLVAPGISIVSVRDTGSIIDINHPTAVVGTSYFKGTGTSQAAAVVSGIAALMFQANPSLTPNVAKASLTATASNSIGNLAGAGAGLVDAFGAASAAANNSYVNTPANQGLAPSTGSGSLEASRGSFHVYADIDGDGVLDAIAGETGFGWGAGSWTAGTWTASSWTASSWTASSWSASSWTASSWTAGTWTASSWTASSWTAGTWTASSWTAGSWTAGSWTAGSWTAGTWTAGSWTTEGWKAGSWTASSWS